LHLLLQGRRFLGPLVSFGLSGSLCAAKLHQAGGPFPWQDQGVLNLANSPYAKLHSVPFRAVAIEEGFWSKRRKANAEWSIPTMREELETHGRMA